MCKSTGGNQQIWILICFLFAENDNESILSFLELNRGGWAPFLKSTINDSSELFMTRNRNLLLILLWILSTLILQLQVELIIWYECWTIMISSAFILKTKVYVILRWENHHGRVLGIVKFLRKLHSLQRKPLWVKFWLWIILSSIMLSFSIDVACVVMNPWILLHCSFTRDFWSFIFSAFGIHWVIP